MSLRLPRPGTAAPALVLGAALALTGCGANFESETYGTRTVADGTNAEAGDVRVLNISLQAPRSGDTHEAGDDAEVTLMLANDGEQDDRLVEVTSPAAESIEIQEESEGVDLPARRITRDGVTLQLVGLTEELRPGRYVELTLRFERSGDVSVQVPIATTGEYDEDRERSENFHPIGEEHGEGHGGDDEGPARGEGPGRESGEASSDH